MLTSPQVGLKVYYQQFLFQQIQPVKHKELNKKNQSSQVTMKHTNRPLLLFKDWHGGLNSQDAYHIYLGDDYVLIVLLSALGLTACVCSSSVSFGHP